METAHPSCQLKKFTSTSGSFALILNFHEMRSSSFQKGVGMLVDWLVLTDVVNAF